MPAEFCTVPTGLLDPDRYLKTELLEFGPAGRIPIDRFVFELEIQLALPLLNGLEDYTHHIKRWIADAQHKPNAEWVEIDYDESGQMQVRFI